MTDERRTTAVTLPGEPAGWRATVRDLLRFLRNDSPAREDAVRWLHEEAGATDTETADEQLAFLEAAGVVDATDDRAAPGPAGREFLDTHDEGVLYEALTGAVAGFEPLLESLAVRPLTDVEFRDLLEREFDADLGSTDPVLGQRRWLQALGYLEHDGGVNDLTRAGRRRVETDDDLTPPRANRPGAAGGADPGDAATEGDAAEAAGTADEAADVDPGSAVVDDVDAPEQDGVATDTDGGFAALKRRYDHTCAVCGDRRRRAPDEGYARVHHPMPTDEAHGGPADPENAVVVCPNHHADMAHGLLRIDPRSLEIEHAYEDAVSGRTLATADGHRPGAQYLAYHGSVVADF